MFHKLLLRIERWLGLERYEPLEDPRIPVAPYDIKECPHWGPTEVRVGVFYCEDCKTTYRVKTAPGKPWIIVGYERVS